MQCHGCKVKYFLRFCNFLLLNKKSFIPLCNILLQTIISKQFKSINMKKKKRKEKHIKISALITREGCMPKPVRLYSFYQKSTYEKVGSIFIPLTSLLLINLPELPNYSKDELANKKPIKTGACYPCHYSL